MHFRKNTLVTEELVGKRETIDEDNANGAITVEMETKARQLRNSTVPHVGQEARRPGRDSKRSSSNREGAGARSAARMLNMKCLWDSQVNVPTTRLKILS